MATTCSLRNMHENDHPHVYITLGRSINGGTPSHHPFYFRIFPYQPTSFGYPPFKNSPVLDSSKSGKYPTKNVDDWRYTMVHPLQETSKWYQPPQHRTPWSICSHWGSFVVWLQAPQAARPPGRGNAGHAPWLKFFGSCQWKCLDWNNGGFNLVMRSPKNGSQLPNKNEVDGFCFDSYKCGLYR